MGVHNITGTGTVKYTVIDDHSKKENLFIRDSIHVPTLDVRLISVQQLSQQNNDSEAGGRATADYLKLTLDNHVKTVPYHINSNLPILFIVPGGKIAEAYISRYLHAWDGAYFTSNDELVTWDSNSINIKNKRPNELESTTKFPLIKDKPIILPVRYSNDFLASTFVKMSASCSVLSTLVTFR